MDTGVWYLGPLGDLRPLPTPEAGMDMSVERFGGVHTGIGGNRTMDVMGLKMNLSLAFTYLDQPEYEWLEALYERYIPGPFRMIHPMKRNRLSRNAAAVRRDVTSAGGVYMTGNPANVPPGPAPAGVSIGSRSITWQTWGEAGFMDFDRADRVAVLPEEELCFSAYVMAEGAYADFSPELYWYRNATDITPMEISTRAGSWSADPLWQRLVFAGTAPVGATCVVPRIACGAGIGADIRVGAPQLEHGRVPTPFSLGGGSSTVLVDSLTTSSPRFPLTDCSMTLLEA